MGEAGQERLVFFRKADRRLEVYRIQPNGQLGAPLDSHNDCQPWDLLMAVPGGRLLLYSREFGADLYSFDTNNGRLGVYHGHTNDWAGWTAITVLDGNKIAFYRQGTGRFEVYNIAA